MTMYNVLINGAWREATTTSCDGGFRSTNPATKLPIGSTGFPVSAWPDCDAALDAAVAASAELRTLPGETIAGFLNDFADTIDERTDELAELAHEETALPITPRLVEVEIPRTTNQLRLAAQAAETESWRQATIDMAANIRSCYGPIGPVAVFGPNNFPFAFGSISGGDFAAAIAAGNPVIAKANTSHPGTTRFLAQIAAQSADKTDMPDGTVQLLYRTSHADGQRLVSDPRIGATAYTGSRQAGLALKRMADSAGKPIYLELSSINPVVILPGALKERSKKIVDEFVTSCLMGTGQFCTNPGLVLLISDPLIAEPTVLPFIKDIRDAFKNAPVGKLLSESVANSFRDNLATLVEAGAQSVLKLEPYPEDGYCHSNAMLQISGEQFIERPNVFQTECFGNSVLFVVCDNVGQAGDVIALLEGQLTGGIYSHTRHLDDEAYDQLAPKLRQKVGRLLNDKMPTGVAVSAAMNHGGPYPATGHPGFTAVGLPTSIQRFTMLQCYDNVREHRLPACLRNQNPNLETDRLVDGHWTNKDIAPKK